MHEDQKNINAFTKTIFRCLFLEGMLDRKISKSIYNQQEKANRFYKI